MKKEQLEKLCAADVDFIQDWFRGATLYITDTEQNLEIKRLISQAINFLLGEETKAKRKPKKTKKDLPWD